VEAYTYSAIIEVYRGVYSQCLRIRENERGDDLNCGQRHSRELDSFAQSKGPLLPVCTSLPGLREAGADVAETVESDEGRDELPKEKSFAVVGRI
jgi:hypothetical protein